MSYTEQAQQKQEKPDPETTSKEPTPYEGMLNTFQAISIALQDGVKFGAKEMTYLYIILVFQISMWIIDLVGPAMDEMNQDWLIIFILVKLAVNLAWILWGGWMKKQVQTILAAKDIKQKDAKREWQEENAVIKSTLNDAAIANKTMELDKEKAVYQKQQADHSLMLMTAEKKKYKKLYFDVKAPNGA